MLGSPLHGKGGSGVIGAGLRQPDGLDHAGGDRDVRGRRARVISGISYLVDSHKVNDLTLGLFGDNMWLWGLWDLGIAALAIWAAFSLVSGGEFGRVIAYAWAILVIVNSFLVIGLAPWFAAGMITLAVLVIYGLASTPPQRTETT